MPTPTSPFLFPAAAPGPTCRARVVGHGEWIAVFLGVHGEQAHTEAPVAGIGCAVVKVLQIHVELVGGLRGQGVDPPEPWSGGENGRSRVGGLQGDPPQEGTKETREPSSHGW